MRKSRQKFLRRLNRFLNSIAPALLLTVLVYVIFLVALSDKFDTIDKYWSMSGAIAVYLTLSLLINKANKARLLTRNAIITKPEALESKLYELSHVLREVGQSLRDIEIEISARESAARQLRVKTEQLQLTQEMHKEDAKRIGDFLTQQLGKHLKEMNQKNLKANLISILVTVIASVPIGILINTYW